MPSPFLALRPLARRIRNAIIPPPVRTPEEIAVPEPPNLNDRVPFGDFCRTMIDRGQHQRLERYVRECDLRIFDAMRPTRMHDLTQFERTVFLEICNDACQGPEACAQLIRSVDYLIDHNIQGDIVECGVFRGASIIAMIRALQRHNISNREIWLYDTFEGMPEPEAIDQFYCETEGQNFEFWEKTKRRDGSGGSDWVRAELGIVHWNVMRCGYPEERLHFIKGLVEDTIPATIPDKISLLRLDTDFYSSTKHEFEHLYPRVVSGGVVVIDDYGAYKGSREATDEYLKKHEMKILLSRVDEHVRMFVKP